MKKERMSAILETEEGEGGAFISLSFPFFFPKKRKSGMSENYSSGVISDVNVQLVEVLWVLIHVDRGCRHG